MSTVETYGSADTRNSPSQARSDAHERAARDPGRAADQHGQRAQQEADPEHAGAEWPDERAGAEPAELMANAGQDGKRK